MLIKNISRFLVLLGWENTHKKADQKSWLLWQKKSSFLLVLLFLRLLYCKGVFRKVSIVKPEIGCRRKTTKGAFWAVGRSKMAINAHIAEQDHNADKLNSSIFFVLCFVMLDILLGIVINSTFENMQKIGIVFFILVSFRFFSKQFWKRKFGAFFFCKSMGLWKLLTLSFDS